MAGVEEEAVVFQGAAAFASLERFRTFGANGPLYEILDASSDRFTVQVIESGETLTYPAAAAAADPPRLMFAIAFDLVVAETEARHPKGVSQAYDEIGRTLGRYGFSRIQGSVYTTDEENLANLFAAMTALKAVPWFPDCVRDIRAFRIEQWSDFTPLDEEQSMKVRVHIFLKPGVLDVQGKAVKGALKGLGWTGVAGARVGKLIEFDLDGVEDPAAEAKKMCETLLANTVIESYRIEVA